MEEMSMHATQMQKPIKTEWNSRCVIFTYFQGDIGSVVDEHFSRALSNIKSPQELSPFSQSGDVILKNDSDMPPNQWRFSSQWTKPQPEVSFANGTVNCITNGFGPMAMDQYPVPLTGSPSVQPGELWHFSSLNSAGSPEPEYPHAFSAGHLVPEAQPNGKYESFLNFMQQERCVAYPQQSAMWENCNSAQAARSTGIPFNLPSSSAHCKKYFCPDRGSASASLASGSKKYFCPDRGSASASLASGSKYMVLQTAPSI
ncbi:transcription cofactor vestigial-like protein 1 [Myotis lucifugus]|uniref:transcription cofactor vestigial-like protein 1 n=1 Tax=Myotis lucifugus TaxID=59463 RepID=UPI000CCC6BA7|nr:transcription cofactor vestigial-like protein 1 [Myotis lucifugus]